MLFQLLAPGAWSRGPSCQMPGPPRWIGPVTGREVVQTHLTLRMTTLAGGLLGQKADHRAAVTSGVL